MQEELENVHAWKLLLEIEPIECPALTSPLVENIARPIFPRG